MRKLCYVPRLGILLFILTFSMLNLTVRPINGLPQPSQSWTTIKTGVIQSSGGYDTEIGFPTAIQDGTKFDVWYSGLGSDNIGRIRYADSTDRVTFTKTGFLLGPTYAWESAGMFYPSVVHIGTDYSIWYTGINAQGDRVIGLAYSTPVGWTKPSAPVLVASQSWEAGGIGSATVLWDQQAGIYRMWYSAGSTVAGTSGIGYAVSRDGFSWSKWIGNPVLIPDSSEGDLIIASTVVKVGAVFWMWYSTVAPYTIRSAWSLDGINWNKWSQNPVLTGTNAVFPSVFPWFDSKTGQLRMGMYYGGSTIEGIDYAESNFGLGTAPLFMNPPVGETYFINGDPYRSQTTAYDSLSAGILYGSQPAFVNHYMGFDTNAAWVAPGLLKGRLVLSGQWAVTMGGPVANMVVAYYEEKAGVTPIFFKRDNNLNLLELVDGSTNMVKAQISATANFDHEDYVVIEQFSADGNNILMIYAFNWKGTWAGGIWFKDYFWTHSYQFVGYSYVILHWVDSGNMDGNPQANEISVYAGG